MKKSIIITSLLIIGINSLLSQMTERDTVFNSFRAVSINNNKTIALQSDINKLNDVVIKSGGDHYKLKDGAFIRAASIDLEVNKKNQIVAITFGYDTTYSYLKGSYSDLGIGKEYLFNSDQMTIKTTKWEDALTVFELVEVITNRKIQVYSVLFDKTLYMEKINLHYSLADTDNSLELLRRLTR
jgi:hypothetical protein